MSTERLTRTHFDEIKATQAACLFIELAGGSINYMVLIKLLYLLDRATLQRRGRVVSGGEYFSMKLGPVVSEVLDLITEQQKDDEKSFWARHISEPNGYSVTLQDDAGGDSLSEAEEESINEIFAEYKKYIKRPFDFVDHLHDVLPEWTPVERGREPLHPADVLKGAGKNESQIQAIQADLRELEAATTVLG